jgi:hypothetical protein
VFIENPLSADSTQSGSGTNKNLILGLVLGLGFPAVVGSIIAYGLWNLKRKGARREAMSRVQRLKNGTVIAESERR